jgi:hypothetical protein
VWVGGLGGQPTGILYPPWAAWSTDDIPLQGKVTQRWIFTVNGRFGGGGPSVWGADSAYQTPTSKRPSNAQDAASGKSLAKCENPLCLRHFGEHWLILRALSLTTNGHLFPVV